MPDKEIVKTTEAKWYCYTSTYYFSHVDATNDEDIKINFFT